MEENHCSTDPTEEGYSVKQLCSDITGFMKREGFGIANREWIVPSGHTQRLK
jgi:hypothetical protein